MTDYASEQTDELESLECLYPTTFKRDVDEPNKKFELKIEPHPDADEPNHVGMILYVEYTPKYPDEIPKFRIECIKGLKDKQIKELLQLTISLANDNIGAPSIFTICTELQEWLIQNNIPSNTSLHDQMKAQNDLKARLQRLTFGDEQKTDHHTAADAHGTCTEFDKSYQRAKGTPVTKKTFAKWSKEFLKTYRHEEKEKFDKLHGIDDKRDKLTGVEIFEQKAKEKLNLMDMILDDNDNIDNIELNPDDIDDNDNDNNVVDNNNIDKKKKKKKKEKKKEKKG